MSYLIHKQSDVLRASVKLPRRSLNQLELCRRAFELSVPVFLADILERGIQEEFEARLMSIGALPGFEVDPTEYDPLAMEGTAPIMD